MLLLVAICPEFVSRCPRRSLPCVPVRTVFHPSAGPTASPSVLVSFIPAHPLSGCLANGTFVGADATIPVPKSPTSSPKPCFLAHVHSSLDGKYLYWLSGFLASRLFFSTAIDGQLRSHAA